MPTAREEAGHFRALHSLGVALQGLGGIESGGLKTTSGALVSMDNDGTVTVTYQERVLRLDQLPGLATALERAQAEGGIGSGE